VRSVTKMDSLGEEKRPGRLMAAKKASRREIAASLRDVTLAFAIKLAELPFGNRLASAAVGSLPES
jgi:hypothetical protein